MITNSYLSVRVKFLVTYQSENELKRKAFIELAGGKEFLEKSLENFIDAEVVPTLSKGVFLQSKDVRVSNNMKWVTADIIVGSYSEISESRINEIKQYICYYVNSLDMKSDAGTIFRMTIIATRVSMRYKDTYIPRFLDAATSRNGYDKCSRKIAKKTKR